MEMNCFLSRNGQQAGPFTENDVTRMRREAAIVGSDLFWRNGMAEWRTITSVFETDALPPPLPSPVVSRIADPFDSPPRVEEDVPNSTIRKTAALVADPMVSVVGKPAPPSDIILKSQNAPRISLWNPNTCANWSYLLTPIFGSLLQHYNWKSLGNAKEAKVSLIWCLVLVAFTATMLVAGYDARLPGLILLFAWYFAHARKQVDYVKRVHGEAYVHKKFTPPVLLAVASMAGILLIAAGALSGWQGFSVFKASLPKVDSPEVVAAAEKALADSKFMKFAGSIIGKIKITNPKELKSHSDDEKRMARAQITTNLGNETVYYSVEWQDEAAKTFWVEFHDKPD
ncbi:MAG: hypothetical protein JWL81_74 [Verrucomicrobiales bacterium]|nr:hypothetical protein [Verrucomicrobiales bacterium]